MNPRSYDHDLDINICTSCSQSSVLSCYARCGPILIVRSKADGMAGVPKKPDWKGEDEKEGPTTSSGVARVSNKPDWKGEESNKPDWKGEDEKQDPTKPCGMTEVPNKPDWMGKMGPNLMNAKVGEVIWPGTHDSGANCQLFDFNKVVDDQLLRYLATYILKCSGRNMKQFASDWSRAQSLTIRQQLDHGVRYIDLRVSKYAQDQQYYTVHTFCGPPLEDALNDLLGFVSEHKGECLLVQVAPISGVDLIELHAMFERKLGGFLLKRESASSQVSPMSFTLSHLMEKGRIVVLYKYPAPSPTPALRGCMEDTLCFWDSVYIHAPFVASLDPTVKERFQLENFTKFFSKYQNQVAVSDQIFHFMYALTPSLGEIVRSAPIARRFIPAKDVIKMQGLQDCALIMNPRLGPFLEGIETLVRSSDIGMIVSVDYVQDSDLLELVLSFNKYKFGT